LSALLLHVAAALWLIAALRVYAADPSVIRRRRAVA
jgi:hypothetical protein